MADDFIESDPFDPEVVRQAEEVNYVIKDTASEALSKYIQERRLAYIAVFSAGNATPGDIEFVMRDLASFCRAYEPTFDLTNQKKQDLLEGRREVFMRIMSFTRLTHDQLFAKLDVTTKR